MKARVALEAFEEGQNGGCSGSSELAIVVPRRSWREVFRWKTEERHEEKKVAKKKEKRPVETDAADGNPQRARIPTAA